MTSRHVTLWMAAAAAAVTVILETVLPHEAHGPWWLGVPAFDLIFGFVGCVGLVWTAKTLGAHWLQRAEGADAENEP